MKKSELIEALATKTGLTKTECEKVFNTIFEFFKDELAKGENFRLRDLGHLKLLKEKPEMVEIH